MLSTLKQETGTKNTEQQGYIPRTWSYQWNIIAYTKDNVHRVNGVHLVGGCFIIKPRAPGATCPVVNLVKRNLFPFASCCAAMSCNVKRNLFPVVQMLHGNFLHSAKRCTAMTYSDKAAR